MQSTESETTTASKARFSEKDHRDLERRMQRIVDSVLSEPKSILKPTSVGITSIKEVSHGPN